HQSDGVRTASAISLGWCLPNRQRLKTSILPEGFAYALAILSPAEERELIGELQSLPFREFEFHGFLGRRRVVSFGWRYDFSGGGLHEAGNIPRFLLPLRGMVAGFASLAAADLQDVLITEYPAGATIGWHKDRPAFGDV